MLTASGSNTGNLCSQACVSSRGVACVSARPVQTRRCLNRPLPSRCCAPGSSESNLGDTKKDQGPPKSLLAGGAIGFGAAAFVALRLFSGAPTFENLERASIPLDTALQNGKPTVIEFYASWCNICRELLPDTLEVCSPVC